MTGQPRAERRRPRGQDHPDPDAVHPHRHGSDDDAGDTGARSTCGSRTTPRRVSRAPAWSTTPRPRARCSGSSAPTPTCRPTGRCSRRRRGRTWPTASPSRTFPDLAQVLRQHQRRDGTCPPAPAAPPRGREQRADPTSSSASRSSCRPRSTRNGAAAGGRDDFRLTARDQFPTGGGTPYDDVTLTVDPQAGPFLVTSRATAGHAAPRVPPRPSPGTSPAPTAATLRPKVQDHAVDRRRPDLPDRSWRPARANDGTEQVMLPRRHHRAGRGSRSRRSATTSSTSTTPTSRSASRSRPSTPETTITSGPARRSFVTTRRPPSLRVVDRRLDLRLHAGRRGPVRGARRRLKSTRDARFAVASSLAASSRPTPATRCSSSQRRQLSRVTRLEAAPRTGGNRGAFT